MNKTPNNHRRPTRTRGRPRLERPMADCGTPELAMKRALGLTAEALDLCLERGVITTQQHWCGVHFRWLYTLRFGAPGARTIDPRHLGGLELVEEDDPRWRAAREQEYVEASRVLGRRLHTILLKIAVYNEPPVFLHEARGRALSAALAVRCAEEHAALIEAMEVLANIWCGKKKVPQAENFRFVRETDY